MANYCMHPFVIFVFFQLFPQLFSSSSFFLPFPSLSIHTSTTTTTPNQKNMCGEVIESAVTVFHFDPLVCERLFDVIDCDTDGKLTVQEIMTSGSDPKEKRREDPTNRCMNERVDTMARIHWSARMKERVCVCANK
jgi:hypothetical protein